MKRAKRVLQFIWLLPATVLAWLFYVLPMWLIFRDLVWMGWADFLVAEFSLAKSGMEPWYAKLWRDWGGWGGPCVIIWRRDRSAKKIERTRLHELEHCYQQFRWGIFHYPVYGTESAFIWVFQPSKHAYYDNHFERAARRAAGQQVEIPREQWAKGRNDRWPWW